MQWEVFGVQILAVFLGLCHGVTVTQKERFKTIQAETQTDISCEHDDSSYIYIYWYRQEINSGQTGLQLIGLSIKGNSPQMENKNYNIDRQDVTHASLIIPPDEAAKPAKYFCAVSQTDSYNSDRLYFGQGTRLTVLEEGHNVTHPKVTIFSPSKSELEKHRKATIVCLATDFYPDHVILTWYLNNNPIADGIKTEEPKYENKKYSLISRLRITAKQWQNSKNNFTCKVDFYSSSGSRSYEASIIGEECDSQASTNELYLRQANLGKLVYILLIFKSALYGAFIMHLKIRKKFCGN